MCNFEFTSEITKEEVDNAMFMSGEYKEINGKYFIPNVLGFRDGYICPCELRQEISFLDVE